VIIHRAEAEAIARSALARYVPASPSTELSLVNLSENATFVVRRRDAPPAVLRVHRSGYQSAETIASELDWLEAVRRDTDVSTPGVIRSLDDQRVVSLEHRGEQRHVVMFEWMAGVSPEADGLDEAAFRRLGTITASLHEHARSWTRPQGFIRFSWEWENTLGENGRWGRWQDGGHLDDGDLRGMEAAGDLVRRRLAAFGAGPDRFGLVHADLRLANLLVAGDDVTVIDFDDSGFSWFLYDFGAAVSFMEDDPRLPRWQAAWLDGYRSVSALPPEHEEMLPTFVLLRRMLLLAWMGSHSHTREVAEMGPRYAAGTAAMAARYVASGGTALT